MSVREAIVGADLEAFGEALAPDVVWVGLWPGELCRNRDDVFEMFERMGQRDVQPQIVLDRDEVLVVDPQLDGRHHVIVLRDDRVSEVRAFPDRRSALAAVEDRPW